MIQTEPPIGEIFNFDQRRSQSTAENYNPFLRTGDLRRLVLNSSLFISIFAGACLHWSALAWAFDFPPFAIEVRSEKLYRARRASALLA